jgi:pilin isopeptide linkage protein
MPMPANATATVTGEGTTALGAFGSITFTEEGTYVYHITEDALTPTTNYVGYVRDTSVFVITITVTDHSGNLIQEAIAQKQTGTGNVDVSVIEFINEYTPEATDAHAMPGVYKTIDTEATIPGDKTFTFSIAADSFTAAAGSSATLTPAQMPMPVTTSVTTTGEGASAVFGTVAYEYAGTYIYLVTEDNLPVAGYDGYTKDNTIYELTITVTDNNGSLKRQRQSIGWEKQQRWT